MTTGELNDCTNEDWPKKQSPAIACGETIEAAQATARRAIERIMAMPFVIEKKARSSDTEPLRAPRKPTHQTRLDRPTVD